MTGENAPSRGEKTRAAIMDAAMKLFLQKGYNGTSMRQIAAEAGITASSIYNHFASKREIFTALFAKLAPMPSVIEAWSEVTEEDSALSPSKGPAALLRGTADTLLTILEENADFFRLIFIDILEFDGQTTQNYFRELVPRGLDLWQGLVTHLQASGQLRDIPPLIFARAFIGLFFAYFVTQRFLLQGVVDRFDEDWVDGLLDILLHGVLKDGGE